MDWGIPTLIEAPSPEESAALCRELGFSFVELNMNLPQYQQLDADLLQDVSARYQVYFTIHLDENLDVCSFNPKVADAYLQTMLDAICFARRSGIQVLNMHLQQGVYFTLPDKKVYLYDMNRSHFLSRVQETITLCENAAQNMVTVCIENTGVLGMPFLREAAGIFLQSPLFGLTFDIGHDHSAGGVDKPFILQHTDKLKHFHIHDALGRKNHMALGTGELDLVWYIALAKKNHCRAVLEVKTTQALRKSVDWLNEQQLI